MIPTPSPAGISSKKDVTLYEVFDLEGTFLCSRFTHLDAQNHVWVGEKNVRKRELTIQDLNSALYKVPDEQAYPEAPKNGHITIATSTDPRTYYLKRPKMHCLLDEYQAPLVPQMLLAEIHTLEFLKDHLHPNIVVYHGCTIERGHLTSIVLQRLPQTLNHRFHDAPRFDLSVFESQLRDAVRHIHELGLAHNDLNPSNIALNERDEPILIDWGSCNKFGEGLISAGTPGWIDDDFDTSKKVSGTFVVWLSTDVI